MERNVIVVPKGIRFISEWADLESYLPQDAPYIMNKTITGCGYTEYCITNNKPIILCSPRLVLLENKASQHEDMDNLLYLKNEYDKFEEFDLDISKDDLRKIMDVQENESEEEKTKAEEYTIYFKKKVTDHVFKCKTYLGKPVKFLVTYDSFRRVKEALGKSIGEYQIIVDECQSIFTDSRFKSDTENTFLNNLRGLSKIVYLSATPMMDKYLEMLDEFKDLPYYELDWGTKDPERVVKPYLKVKQLRGSLISEADRIIESYRKGEFEKIVRENNDKGTFEEIYSKEAVIYVNSVKNITDIIRKSNLTLEDTNVLCSDDEGNEKRVRSAFKKNDKTITSKTKCIGTVPKEGEQHKMFTLCTRTVYLGADFYSTNARSFIFSDANIDCLSVDITLDLPQILGRQRLEENPWKNRAELYYKLNTKELSEEVFNEYLEDKKRSTEIILTGFTKLNSTEKHKFAEGYKTLAFVEKYKKNFVAVDEHAGSDLVPIFNKLVMIAEMRAFEIQQVDYKDRFSVFSALYKEVSEIEDVNREIDTFYSFSQQTDRYKYLCSLSESMAKSLLPHIPESFGNYYIVLGPEKMRALRYNITDMKNAYNGIIGNQDIDIGKEIKAEFIIGEIYSKAVVKDKLREIYKRVGYDKTPRAVDLGDYFYIKDCMITNKDTGKRDASYKITGIKEGGSV